jgi:hypothetical protein
MSEGAVPDDLAAEVEAKRAELVERVSEVSDPTRAGLSLLLPFLHACWLVQCGCVAFATADPHTASPLLAAAAPGPAVGGRHTG